MQTTFHRIVADNYNGFEVQVWHLWFPFWVQKGWANTFPTIDQARAYAKNSKVLEYVD